MNRSAQTDPAPGGGASACTGGAHWTCPQASDLQLRQWDDDAAVVYDHSTGHTHLIDALAAHLLRQLQAGPAVSQALLICSVQSELAEPAASEPADLVAQGLDSLRALGLAQPLPAPPG